MGANANDKLKELPHQKGYTDEQIISYSKERREGSLHNHSHLKTGHNSQSGFLV